MSVEGDRAIIRDAALKIIRVVLEKKKAKLDVRKDWLAPPPLSVFQRLEPLGFGVTDNNWWIFRPEECTPDIVWPLDVGTVCEQAGDDHTLRLMRNYTVTPKEVRGYATRFSPFMVRGDHGQMSGDALLTASTIAAWIGGKWVNAENRVTYNGSIPERWVYTERDSFQVNLAISIALRQRYEWAVSLGLEDSPSVRFATDPTGIKEVFRVRDLPEGRDRREALLTWVTDHWRQDRHDPEVETYVRKHLRGTTGFTWRGMSAEIVPSQFDIDQRNKLISERAAMRAAGKDRRLVTAGNTTGGET